MYSKEHGLYIAHCDDGALSICGRMANRHGLIAGATGTGKGTSINKASAGFYTGVVSINAGETVWGRGYLIYRDAVGDLHTVYSPIASYTR